jgi:formylglycine-generating enzyme required for sulfatase activity
MRWAARFLAAAVVLAASVASAQAPKAKVGESFKECPECPDMVVIPAGSFIMGSPANELGHHADETPRDGPVSIGSIAVGKFEVTFAQWDACVAGGGCVDPETGPYMPPDQGWGRGRQPVINVSWLDAERYVRWLNGRVGGAAYRLLSEAEWEYAARAGTTTPFSFGAAISTAQANYNGEYAYGAGAKGAFRQRTSPVGSFPPNKFGLYDMHGNVWEWVEDCYAGSYAGLAKDGSANTTEGCSNRVLRGGSWSSYPEHLRSAYRFITNFTFRFDNWGVGFRVARTL